MYKTGHAFTYLLLKESVANDLINVSLFACCEPRHWRVEASSVGLCCGWRRIGKSSVEVAHHTITYDCYSQNNNVKMETL